MPRCLALDWDRDRCQILVGNATRSGVVVERALVWPQEEVGSERQAEEAGKTLREFLKSSGVAPAPVLICVPRQRVLLKEIRCPNVAAADEPAIVRFQAAKELLESPEDVVLDYAYVSQSAAGNQILVAALRKDWMKTYQALCRGAGLQLMALTPRPFALGHCLSRARKMAGTDSAQQSAAVLLLSESWAELSVLHGGTVVFSRALSEDAVEGEVRRSLALFASQAEGQFPQALYLIDREASTARAELDDRLQTALKTPVTRPQLFSDNDPPARDVNPAAALGLLTAFGEGEDRIPVNFAKPKEPKVEQPVDRKLWLLIGAAAAVLLMFLFLIGQSVLANKRAEIQLAVDAKADAEQKLKGYAQEKLDLDALKEWDQNSVPWIDEFYDIAARFPQRVGLKLTKIHAEPIARTAKEAKDAKQGKERRYIARLMLTGLEPAGKEQMVYQFLEYLNDDHLRSQLERSKAGPAGSDSQEFSLRIDLTRQPPEKYSTRLALTKGAP